MKKIFLSTYDHGVSRAEKRNGQWEVNRYLEGRKVRSLAQHPDSPEILYAGVVDGGIWISEDAGVTWNQLALTKANVKSIAVNPFDPSEMLAGVKPAGILRSKDGGNTWVEMENFQKIKGRWWWFSPADPPGMAPYVNNVEYSPTEKGRVIAGVELGAVVQSEDGGESWSNHLKNTLRDCHSLKFHATDGNYAYEAGGSGLGGSLSKDGGRTWRKARLTIRKGYGIVCGFDYYDPEIWYVVSGSGPGSAFGANSKAYFYRRDQGKTWKEIGWQSHPLSETPTQILASKGGSGHVYVGLQHGQILQSKDYGENWERLPFKLDGIWFNLIAV
jgi:photosystem II stability/assembly factor-like uncharacterized protein